MTTPAQRLQKEAQKRHQQLPVNDYGTSWWLDQEGFYARAKQELPRMALRSPYGRAIPKWTEERSW